MAMFDFDAVWCKPFKAAFAVWFNVELYYYNRKFDVVVKVRQLTRLSNVNAHNNCSCHNDELSFSLTLSRVRFTVPIYIHIWDRKWLIYETENGSHVIVWYKRLENLNANVSVRVCVRLAKHFRNRMYHRPYFMRMKL